MICLAATNKGKVRQNNEDFYYIPGKVDNLFILADGMGGHLAGEKASRLAVNSIIDFFLEKKIESEKDLIDSFRKSIEEANTKIFSLSQNDLKFRGMGTTLSIGYKYNGYLYYSNIGDSRIYEVEEDKITQLTKDDSYVNYLLEIGEISEEDIKNHPKKNVLTKALGTSEKIDFCIKKLEMKKENLYLFCSDGLTNMVEDEKILEIIKESNIKNISSNLINEAIENGGMDNVTLIIVK